jgi:hypothetical protein
VTVAVLEQIKAVVQAPSQAGRAWNCLD